MGFQAAVGVLQRSQSANALKTRYGKETAKYRNARVVVSQPPAVRGLGSGNGVSFMLKDTGGAGYGALAAAKDEFVRLAENSPYLRKVRAKNQDPRAQLVVDIDNDRAAAMQVAPATVNQLLNHALGGSYANDFVHNGRVKRVYSESK